MPKLYFRHGTVGSAKTLNLLAVAHNYRQQGKQVRLLKPALDTRFGQERITSRAGLSQKADLLLEQDTKLDPQDFSGVHCILVDEAQFLSEQLIEQLRDLTRSIRVPVICYGLRTDFKSCLFPASRRLMELADSIEEIKVTCAFCNHKGVLNLKQVDGVPVREGQSVELGAEELYQPACYSCYAEKLGISGSWEREEALA